jgi:hypothetical protein
VRLNDVQMVRENESSTACSIRDHTNAQRCARVVVTTSSLIVARDAVAGIRKLHDAGDAFVQCSACLIECMARNLKQHNTLTMILATLARLWPCRSRTNLTLALVATPTHAAILDSPHTRSLQACSGLSYVCESYTAQFASAMTIKLISKIERFVNVVIRCVRGSHNAVQCSADAILLHRTADGWVGRFTRLSCIEFKVAVQCMHEVGDFPFSFFLAEIEPAQ